MDKESDSVLKWLREQGFPLELSVGQALREHGWHVRHATWYQDPATNKSRELDILATYSASTTKNDAPLGGISVMLAIECKSSKNKPWVALSAPGGRFTDQLLDACVADEYSRSLIWASMALELETPGILHSWPPLAHGLVSVHAKNDQGDPTAAYAALKSVTTAAAAIGDKEAARVLDQVLVFPFVHLVLPIVVFDGGLFHYSLDEFGIEHFERATSVAVATAGPEHGDCIVRVVSAPDFATFVREVTPGVTRYCDQCLGILPRVLELHKQKRAGRAPIV